MIHLIGSFLFSVFFLCEIAESSPLRIVVTFSILENLVRQIIQGDADIDIYTIVPYNTDPHTYEPRPEDAKRLSHAQLVIINGLSFECGWLEKLIVATQYKGSVIIASRQVIPRVVEGQTNPHAWQTTENAKLYANEIFKSLCQLNRESQHLYGANYKQLIEDLEHLEVWICQEINRIKDKKRFVLTTHDAFSYYGAAYGIQFCSPLGMNTKIEPSARSISLLIQQIRQKNIRAVFLENLTNPRLIQQIVAETGLSIQGTLYADTLSSPEGPANSYQNMMRHNTSMIVSALLS